MANYIEWTVESYTGKTSSFAGKTRDLANKVTADWVIKTEFNGSYTDESIACKIQKSADGSNWVDTGIELTATSGTDYLSASCDVTGRYYRVYCTLSGTSPNYDVEIRLVTKD